MRERRKWAITGVLLAAALVLQVLARYTKGFADWYGGRIYPRMVFVIGGFFSFFVIFPNHQGMFDVLALLECCPHPFTVVMKKEVANIFLVKQIRRLLKAQFIDREDVRGSVQVIRQMTAEVKEGRNYVIFAEGTRSKHKNRIQSFKGGSFKSAINARCPIVPVALIDSFKPFDSHSVEPVTVQVYFLPPLYYEAYKDMKSLEIAALVQQRVAEKINDILWSQGRQI